MRSLVCVPLVLLFACATVQSTGTFDRPDDSPTLLGGAAASTTALQCEPPDLLEGTAAAPGEALDARLALTLGAARVEVSRDESREACRSLARDRVLYDDALFGTEWAVSEAVTALVQRVARDAEAAQVWIPLVRPRKGCAEEDLTETYARPREPLAFEGDSCAPSELDLALFLFDAQGKLLWKSTTTTAAGGPAALASTAGAADRLVADLPPRAPADRALVTDTPP